MAMMQKAVLWTRMGSFELDCGRGSQQAGSCAWDYVEFWWLLCMESCRFLVKHRRKVLLIDFESLFGYVPIEPNTHEI